MINAHLPPADAVGGRLTGKRVEDQRSRNDLGDDGRIGDAVHFHVEHKNKDQVEHGIEERGDDEKNQRAPGIADGPENAAAHVIEEDADDTAEIDGQVQSRVFHDVIRRLHEAQHGLNDEEAQNGGNDAENQCNSDRGMDGFSQSLMVVGAIALGNHDGSAGGKPGTETDHGIDDTAGGTHGSLCLFRNKIADNQRIDRVVQLLKKQPDDHRNGKFNQMPPDTAFGHVGIRAHAASQYNRLPNADYIIGAGKKHRGKR